MNSCSATTALKDSGCSTNLALFPHFTDTVISSLLLAYLIASNITKWMKLWTCETSFRLKSLPRLLPFNPKTVLTLFLATLAVVHQSVYGFIHSNDNRVTLICLHIFLWPVALAVLFFGRQTLIPLATSRGHAWILPIFWTFAFINENLIILNVINEVWSPVNLQSSPDKLIAMIFALRYIFTLMLFMLGLSNCWRLRRHPQLKKLPSVEEKEATPTKKPSEFVSYFEKLKMFIPFLWPKGSPVHQFFLFACLAIMIFGRYLTVKRPQFYKDLVDSLSSSEKEEVLLFRWDLVVAYVGLEFLQELLANLRSSLWDQVEEFTGHNVHMSLFRHLHKLSLGWHLSKKTGEVLEASSRGITCARELLRDLLFTVLPSAADICIAAIYFVMTFNIWFGVILFTTMILYAGLTYALTMLISKLTDDVIRLRPDVGSTRVDSLLNFETVKCYNNEEYEISKYDKSLQALRTASFKYSIAYDSVHLTQKAITTGGLLAGSLLCVYLIATKQGMTLGDYVLFAAYTHHFFAPMYAFGGIYSFMQRAFKEMEKMYEILNQEEDVKDIPGAPDLVVTQGRIEFKDVSFHYKPEKPILKNISFVVHPGQAIAFVGPTGSGKSTIARLLFRLYNIEKGDISIDGQSITEVTQKSVRRAIGVVPQDTVLFNEDIRFNIRYGKLDASDEQVEEAAIAAEIHDTILRFPDGYEAKVGERGLKLSGGEKQRIAIARTILKSAPITLLDEATSALDTQTERRIQASLKRLCACKTAIIIAHRLSTVIHAHQICVLKGGEIVERGTHEELLNLGEVYSSMWQSQMKELSQAEAEAGVSEDGFEENNYNETRLLNRKNSLSVPIATKG